MKMFSRDLPPLEALLFLDWPLGCLAGSEFEKTIFYCSLVKSFIRKPVNPLLQWSGQSLRPLSGLVRWLRRCRRWNSDVCRSCRYWSNYPNIRQGVNIQWVLESYIDSRLDLGLDEKNGWWSLHLWAWFFPGYPKGHETRLDNRTEVNIHRTLIQCDWASNRDGKTWWNHWITKPAAL